MRATIPYRLVAVTLCAALLSGCAGLAYYAQSIGGQFDLLRRSRPIDELLGDPATPPGLKARLERVQRIRDFASGSLALPDNASYRRYADLQRPYAVWNVFAAPELSLQPKRWCFPVVGCVAYRGYFDRAAAERSGARLAAQGLDVYVGGVPAYSTLGWFDDPVLNTVIELPPDRLAGLIFHELAHQVAYAEGDTTFNESFATLVELEGTARWFATGARADLAAAYRRRKEREQALIDLLMDYRARLAAVYARPVGDQAKREAKRALFAALSAELGERFAGAGAEAGRWTRGWNNARLAAVGTYHAQVPALRRLLARSGGDLERFYRQVRALAALPAPRRRERLEALAPPGPRARPVSGGRPGGAGR